MAKQQQPVERRGIFGPDWHRWRLCQVWIEPPDGPAYLARLQDRKGACVVLSKIDPKDATKQHTIGDIEMEWPPEDGTKITVRTA